ncbi:Low affinity immunoglobulin epsilon Fc receptor-like protein, partial [Leptotrombidium deliense]
MIIGIVFELNPHKVYVQLEMFIKIRNMLLFLHSCTFFTNVCCIKCLQNWVYFNGKCYMYSEKTVTFEECYKKCNAFNAEMIAIKSSTDMNFVHNLLKKEKANSGVWFGALREHVEDKNFLWSDGTFTDSHYNNWGSGFPSGTHKDNFKCVIFAQSNGQWEDADCDKSHA